MAKKPQIKPILILLISLLLCLIVLGGAVSFLYFFNSRVYPGTYVKSLHLGGLTKSQAVEKIAENFTLPDQIKIRVLYPQPVEYNVPLSLLEAKIDYETTVLNAFMLSRTRPLFRHKTSDLVINYNATKLEEQLGLIDSDSPNRPVSPKLVLNQNTLSFIQGEAGIKLEKETLRNEFASALGSLNSLLIITPDIIDPTLNREEEQAFLRRGQLLLSKSLVLEADNYGAEYAKGQIISLLHPKGGYYFDLATPSLSDISSAVNTPPKNPVFAYEEGIVKEFSPAVDGLEVNITELQNKMYEGLSQLEETDIDTLSLDIPVARTPPDFATEDVNNMGIKELIGVGKSSFRGSIPSRVYNISLAASRLNGILIKPGETFSFVHTLGDISAFTGYKQAYIISGGQTILGDGGGVCQVSTTFFRAALAAGLPIVERHPHSYRVGYYEQDSPPGIDATIFHPTVDLKVKNDTPGHILIQAYADPKNATLRFELYGTHDGRISTVTKPLVSSVTPPPDDLYIDDPTLPVGEIKQIDYKAWGAKVNFSYKVERNGETLYENTFYSNYRPWQAKFLRGVDPAQ